MLRRTQLLHVLAALGAAVSAAVSVSRPALAQEGPGQKPRNVLLYVADDLGRDMAGCYGNPVVKTPGLDRLAAEGVRFTHAYCTTASCSASRSVILSGLHNHANGQYGHQHAVHHFASFPTVQSLPVLLAEAGYRTASIGKFHVAPEEVYHFQQYFKGNAPAQMAGNCRAFITESDRQPFFLYFCTSEPHRPFRREGSRPVDPKDVIVPPYLPDTAECREELAQYYGSIERGDRGLVRLIEILKETGRWDNTLVVFLSDNGAPFPGAKTTLYDPGMHLPCVVRDPWAKQRGVISDAMVTWADVAPTILDFAGATPKDYAFHGRSFLPVLRGGGSQGWDEIYASHTFHEITMYYPMRAVQTRQHKLIWNIAHGLDYPFASDLYDSATWQGVLRRGDTTYGQRTVDAYVHRPKFELFDLKADPAETKNLAADPQHAEVLAELQAKLKAWQKRTGDPWILKWRYE